MIFSGRLLNHSLKTLYRVKFAHLKKNKGRPYLYVREIARVNSKPTVISQTYIGERVAEFASGREQQIQTLKVEEFGALWLSQQMDKDMDIAGIVDDFVERGDRETGPTVDEYFLYCVWNRMVEAVSKNKRVDEDGVLQPIVS